jgi:hypothetical protein
MEARRPARDGKVVCPPGCWRDEGPVASGKLMRERGRAETDEEATTEEGWAPLSLRAKSATARSAAKFLAVQKAQ